MVPSVKRIVILKKSPPKNGGPVPDAVIAVQLNGGRQPGRQAGGAGSWLSGIPAPIRGILEDTKCPLK